MSINRFLDEIIDSAVYLWTRKAATNPKVLLRLDYYYNDVQMIEKKLIKCLAYKGIKAKILYIPDNQEYFKSILQMEE